MLIMSWFELVQLIIGSYIRNDNRREPYSSFMFPLLWRFNYPILVTFPIVRVGWGGVAWRGVRRGTFNRRLTTLLLLLFYFNHDMLPIIFYIFFFIEVKRGRYGFLDPVVDIKK